MFKSDGNTNQFVCHLISSDANSPTTGHNVAVNNKTENAVSRTLRWGNTEIVHELESLPNSSPRGSPANKTAKDREKDVTDFWNNMSEAVAAATKLARGLRVRLALVGTGRMASIHFKNIAKDPKASVVVVVDDNSLERAQVFVNEHEAYAQTTVSSDLDLALKSYLIDGVVICSASNRHYEHIKIALSHKKPVFVEKPIANSVSEIDELYTMASENGVPPIMVGFQRRFDRNIKNLYTQIHDEKVLCPQSEVEGLTPTIGGIEKIVSISKDPTYPEVEYIGGSINGFYDSMIHDIDTICFLSKQFPDRVYTAAHSHYQPIARAGDYDRVFITMHFPSGLLAMIDWCRHSGCSYDQRLSVQGYGGMLQVDNERTNQVVKHTKHGQTIAKPVDYFLERYAEAYHNEMKEFVRVIQGESEVSTTHEQVRSVNIIVAAAEKSARTGQPVDIRMDESRYLPDVIDDMLREWA